MASNGGTTALRQALRHRPGQSVGLLLLATLISASVTFAPLFVRAVEQSVVRLDLRNEPVYETGLALTSVVGLSNDISAGDMRSLDPDALLALVPASTRRQFGAPVFTRQGQASVGHAPRSGAAIAGQLFWSQDECRHLHLARGRCPQRPREVAISTADVSVLHLRQDDELTVGTLDAFGNPGPTMTLHVVGVYRQVSGPYWFGRDLTGKAGTIADKVLQHDDWITSESTFTKLKINILANERTGVVMPIDRARTGVDQLRALGRRLHALDLHISRTDYGGGVDVTTGVPGLIRDLQVQQHQTRITVPLIVLQLALLGLFVLWLVLGAVADQRRTEVALALLRGRGRRGARRQLLAELVTVTLAGVAVGGVVAAGVSSVCRRIALPENPPFELRWPFWASLAGVGVALALVITLGVHLLTRRPVDALLRRVESRHRAVGTPQAVLLAVAGTGTIAFVTGGLAGNAALAGPAILALLVGVGLSLVVTPLAASTGRSMLRRGRLTGGLTLLDAARSPALRRTVAVITVATALLVFAVDAAVVGDRNRQLAAEQYVGAQRVLSVDGNDVQDVRAAVHEADPDGQLATPVVTVRPPGLSSLTTLAVVPDEFRRVAAGDVSALPLGRIQSSPARPLRVVGGTVVLRVLGSTFQADVGRPARPTLVISLVTPGGSIANVAAGRLPRNSAGPRTLRVPVSCEQGCLLRGLGVAGGVELHGTFSLGPIQVRSVDGTRTSIALAPASQWHRARGERDGADGTIALSSPSPDVLQVDVDTAGSVHVESDWFPAEVPALLAGPLPRTHDGDVFRLAGLDAQPREARRVATVERVPSSPTSTAVVDLDTMQRGVMLDNSDQISVWLGRNDPALVHKVTRALAVHHVRVSGSTTIAARRTTYDRSAAAWSLGLGVAAGILALLIALGVMTVIASTGSRARTHDLAALRLAGVDIRRLRRAVVGHQLLAVVLAVAAGVVTGAIGAQLALDDVPMFTTRPAVSTLDLSVPWSAVLLTAVGALLLLGATGIHLGRRLSRAARLIRLREVE